MVLLLFFAAVLGGALNAVAGGGSFLTFPSLIFSGIAPITANATSTVALWPGSAASAGAYRAELTKFTWRFLALMSSVSLVGGVAGAILLLRTPQATFTQLIPYLLLVATLLFAFSPPIMARLRKRQPARAEPTRRGLAGIAAAQLVIAVYGGYFGGGIGILMLATLGLMGMENIHEMNALKTVLAACINGVAVVTFIIAGAVVWPQALVMVAGAIIGGYGAANYARKLPPRWVRRFVILVGVLMTIYFFARQWVGGA